MTQTHWIFAWRRSLRGAGLLLAFTGAVVLFGLALLDLSEVTLAQAAFDGIAVILPLIAGLGAALIFAPDDEPTLELLLSSPRPPRWLLYERLTAFGLLFGGVGLLTSAIASLQSGSESFVPLVIRWLPPSVAIAGLCLFATVWARRTAHGVLLALVVPAGLAIVRDSLLPRIPELWIVLFYVGNDTLTDTQYFINRLFLLALGLGLLALVFIRMNDEEKVLGINDKGRV